MRSSVPLPITSRAKSTKEVRKNLSARVFLAFLVITSLALPASNFLGIPIKHIAFISYLLILLAQWQMGKRISSNILFALVAACTFVAFFMLTGFLRSEVSSRYVISEGLMFFTAMAVAFSILMAKSMRIVDDKEVIAYTFYGIFIFSLWKSVAGVLVSTGVISIDNLYSFFARYLDYKPVVGTITGGLYRINFIAADFITTSFLFFVPCFPQSFSKIPLLLRRAFMIIGTTCLVFAFSRFLFALIAVLWTYIFMFRSSFKQRIFALFVASTVIVISFSWLQDSFEERFTSENAKYSDRIRTEQTDALMNAWEKFPLLGGGFGYYAKDYVRLEAVPYTYEVQWVSFLAKFGIFGLSFLLLFVFLLFYAIFKEGRTANHYILAFVLLSFIIGGFTNQYLLNAASGIFYIVHLFFASNIQKHT